MFDGLNNNRAHWNELAEVYNAKMKAIEDEKKKLEEGDNKKCNVFIVILFLLLLKMICCVLIFCFYAL